MNLTRAEDGSLTGTYQLGVETSIAFEGKILASKDNDLYLEGADGKVRKSDFFLLGNVMVGDLCEDYLF
jgi:hypothetical protein